MKFLCKSSDKNTRVQFTLNARGFDSALDKGREILDALGYEHLKTVHIYGQNSDKYFEPEYHAIYSHIGGVSLIKN